MDIDDFDGWVDYVPVNEENLKQVEIENPNVIKLKENDEVIFLEFEKEYFHDFFENCRRKIIPVMYL